MAKLKAKSTSRASKPRKSATRPKSPPRAGTKAKPGASEAKPIKVRKSEKVAVLLSGGNPRIAKADGDAPVQAYVAAMPGWKRDLGKRLDALIVRNVPNVRKAVKWNSPMYGIEGQGWFLGFHVFTHYVKVAFFRGSSLRPLPPGPSKDENSPGKDDEEGLLVVAFTNHEAVWRSRVDRRARGQAAQLLVAELGKKRNFPKDLGRPATLKRWNPLHLGGEEVEWRGGRRFGVRSTSFPNRLAFR